MKFIAFSAALCTEMFSGSSVLETVKATTDDSSNAPTSQATKTQDQAMREFAKVATTTDSVTAEPEKKESASANGQDVKFLLLEDIMTDNDYTALCKIKNPHAQFDSLLDLKAGVYALFGSTVGSGLKLDDAAAQALFEDRLIELEDCDKEELFESLQEAKIENPVDKLLFMDKLIVDVATEMIEEFGGLSRLDGEIQTSVADFTSGENRTYDTAVNLIDTLTAKAMDEDNESVEDDNADNESIHEVENIAIIAEDENKETLQEGDNKESIHEVENIAIIAEDENKETLQEGDNKESIHGVEIIESIAEDIMAESIQDVEKTETVSEKNAQSTQSWKWWPKFLRGSR